LGYFGQIKNPPFSYNSLCESYQTSGGQKLVQISSVNCSKFKTEANDVVGENFYGAFVDFDVVGVRNSRQKGA
jgi:hypothetical protein